MSRKTGDPTNDLRRRERESWHALVDAYRALAATPVCDGRAVMGAQHKVALAKENWRSAFLSLPLPMRLAVAA